MSHYLLLVKRLIKMMLATKHDSTKARVGTFVAIGSIYLVVMGYIMGSMVVYVPQFLASGQPLSMLLLIMMSSVFAVVVFIGLISMISYVYFSKDAELLSSLPIKPSTVFLAKMTIVYLTELVSCAMLLVPSMIIIGVMGGLDAVYFLSIPFIVLITPIFPLAIIAILALPIMLVASYFKNRNASTTVLMMILQVVFMIVYLLLIFSLQSSMANADVESAIRLANGVKNALFPLTCLAQFACGDLALGITSVAVSRLACLGLAIAIALALGGFAWLLSRAIYQRGISSQMESGQGSKGKATKYKEGKNSVLTQVKRDFLGMIRNSAVGVQSLSPVILAPLMVFFIGFSLNITTSGVEDITSDELESLAKVSKYSMLWIVLFMCVSLNVSAGTAFSREGKTFELFKSLPITPNTATYAKLIISMSIATITCVLGSVVYGLRAADVGFLETLILLGFLLIYAYAFTCFSMWDDLRAPNLGWSVPNELFKRSTKMMLPMFINMGMSVPMLIVFVTCSYFNLMWLAWILLYPLAIAMAIFWHRLLLKRANEKWYFIEV